MQFPKDVTSQQPLPNYLKPNNGFFVLNGMSLSEWMCDEILNYILQKESVPKFNRHCNLVLTIIDNKIH